MQNFLDAGKIFALISLGHRTHPSNYKPLDGWHESCYIGRR